MAKLPSISEQELELIRALSNSKRLELLKYIYKHSFLIKSDLITEFNLQRAGLDFHLSVLQEAGLIGIMDIKINNRKHAFVFPKTSWEFNIRPLETGTLNSILPSEISNESIEDIIESIWSNETLKNHNIIKQVLRSLMLKLETDLSKYQCNLCRAELAILRCSSCLHFVCLDCSDIIDKSDGVSIVLCDRCIADQFS